MSTKNNPTPLADLRFHHLEFVKRQATHLLKEMMNAGLTEKDIPAVLNDFCKDIVLSRAEANKEDAFRIVEQFIELSADLTSLMMRIVTDNFGEGIESLYEELPKPKK